MSWQITCGIFLPDQKSSPERLEWKHWLQEPRLPGASTRDPTHDKVMREKTWWARWIRFSGIPKSFPKAAPGAHLKDDICFSDACFNRLLPNFCKIGRRPCQISFQVRINLELYKFFEWWYFMRLFRMKEF